MSSAAVAILIRREKQIVQAFQEAGAISADKAVRLEALGLHDRLAMRKLKRHAVIREAAPDYFYLDEPSWSAMRRLRRSVALIMLVVVIIGAVVSLYTGSIGAH